MSAIFEQKAPVIMQNLLNDFTQLEVLDAAAILGNLGHESAGLATLQETHPVSGRGGYGWAQWTGARRVAFEAFAAARSLSPASDEANYGFLKHELETTEAGAITAMLRVSGLENKVKAFEQKFERAGVKNYSSRINYANRALAAYNNGSTSENSNNGGAMQATLIPGFNIGGFGTIGTIFIVGAFLFLIYQFFFAK